MNIFDKDSKFWTFFSIVILVVFIYLASKYFKDFELIIQKAGAAGPLVAIIIYTVLAVTPISTDPLVVVSGVMFGPVLGIIVSWMGNNCAGLVEYYLGNHLGGLSGLKKLKKKLPFGLSRFPVDSSWFLIFGRFIPGFGGKLVSITAGIYHVPVKKYFWTMVVTNLLGSVLLSLGGYGVFKLLKI